jgi:tetraacyldisaccharide 4'-kinase
MSYLLKLILSMFYRSLVHTRNCLYMGGYLKAKKLPGKTISVGNIEVGGTGKTPVVIEIAKYLKQNGFSPVVVTRGYKSGLKGREFVVIENGKYILGDCDYQAIFPDEAMLQSYNLKDIPIVVGAKRYDAVMGFLITTQYKATHFILDDGFQHRQLYRDHDLVLVRNSINVTGTNIMPLGRLREPVPNLNRAHSLLYMRSSLSRDEIINEVSKYLPSLPNIFLAKIKNSELIQVNPVSKKISLDDKSLKPAVACAIAHPQEFIQALEKIGIFVAAERLRISSDHNRLSPLLGEAFIVACDYLVITEKDFYREKDFYLNLKIPVFVLRLELELPAQLFESL